MEVAINASVDFETGLVVWAKAHGNISTGVTLRGDRLYVGLDAGGVMAIDTADGSAAWGAVYPTALPVKGFVYADRLSDDLYFSTSNTVYSISDDGGGSFGWTDNWSGGVAMSNPSPPVFIPGDDKVYVGALGSLVRLKQGTGSGLDAFPLGDGSAAVGSPTIDLAGGFVYVGTESGTVYAIRLVP